MKKILFLLCTVVCMTCVSNSNISDNKTDQDKETPEWIIKNNDGSISIKYPADNKDYMYGVGSAKKNSPEFSIRSAKSRAMAEVSEKLGQSVLVGYTVAIYAASDGTYYVLCKAETQESQNEIDTNKEKE